MSRRVAAGTTLAVVLLALWVMLAPPSIGGWTTLLSTRGASMAPAFSAGDLVVVRRQAAYTVGDVVAYPSPTLRATVLHRIVGGDASGYVTRGDANSWTDTDRPSAADLIGSVSWHLPGMGTPLAALHSPAVRVLFLLAGAAGVISLLGLPRAVSWPRAGSRTAAKEPVMDPGKGGFLCRPGFPDQAGAAVAISAVLSGLACLAGFSNPATTPAHEVPYNLTGTFSYRGAAAAGDLVYRNGQVSSGETVYLELVPELTVRFDSALEAAVPYSGGGIITMSAEILGSGGWRHPLGATAPALFRGGRATAELTIDLAGMRRTIGDIQRATKIRDTSYTLRISPEVRLDGELGNAPLRDAFVAPLDLAGEELALRPDAAKTNGSLTPIRGGVSESGPARPAILEVAGIGLPVSGLRSYGLLALVATMLAGAALTARRRRTPRRLDVLPHLREAALLPAPRQDSDAVREART